MCYNGYEKKMIGAKKMKDDKHLFKEIIDKSIEIDLSLLPKSVKEEIEELEALHEKKDWFFYDLKFDELENHAKGYVVTKKIPESLYKKILAKYGGIYD